MEEYVWEYEWMEDNFTCVSMWKEVVINFLVGGNFEKV